MLMPMALNEDKCHVATQFDHHDLGNSVAPFMMPLPSCDADANDVTSWKCHVAPHFDCLYLRISRTPFMIMLVSCDVNTNAINVTWWKKPCCTLFWSSWPKEFSDTIYDAISINWYWCQYQWHHMMSMPLTVVLHDAGTNNTCHQMTKKVMLHLVLIVLT